MNKIFFFRPLFRTIIRILHIVSYLAVILIWTLIYPILLFRYKKMAIKNVKDYFLKAPSIILCVWCLHIDKFYNIKNIKTY